MKKITALVTCALLVICTLPYCFGYSAGAICVYQPDTDTFLECVRGDLRLPMASTTKIMTALVTLESVDINTEIRIPSVAVGVEGSSMYLAQGEPLTVKELLYGLMLTSGNDAATALAHYIGGGNIEVFVSMMNKKSASLGLCNTNFTNPSGLPDDNHYTTANELAKITAAAMSNPTFAKIVSTKTFKIRKQGIKDGRTLINHNKLLSMYESAVGVKTGFTKKAGRCLVSAAKKDGVLLICVTLNDGDDWNDHITALEKGFSRTRRILLCKSGEVSVKLTTPDGLEVTAKNLQNLDYIVIDNKLPKQVICADKFVYPPKTKNACVGCVKYIQDGKTVAACDLVVCSEVSVQSVQQNNFLRFLNFIRNLIKWNNS